MNEISYTGMALSVESSFNDSINEFITSLVSYRKDNKILSTITKIITF